MKRYLSLAIILSTLLMGIATVEAAQSIESLEQKLSSNPQDTKVLYELTRLYCEHGMENEAIKSWRQLADLAPEKASELYLTAWIAVFLDIEPFYPQPVSDLQVLRPRLSPDGKWITFLSITKGMLNVARMNFFGSDFSWITEDAKYHQFASFVGSGDEVLYTVADESSGSQLIRRNIASNETRVIFSNLAKGITSVDQAKPGSPIVFTYISPDSKTREIGIYDEKKGKFKTLTSSPYAEIFPRFSNDGRLIVFSNNPALNNDIYVMNKKGKILEQITRTDENERSPDFGDNDSKIVFASNHFASTQIDIMMHDRRTGETIPITYNKADDEFPDLSDDGKWLVFQSSRTPDQTSVYFVSLDQYVPIDVLIEEIDNR